MKKSLLYVLIAALTVVTIGCSKSPTKEIDAAKAAIDAVVTEGGEVYAVNETKELNEAYTKAMDEVKIQDQKFFKDYKKSKELLSKVTEGATALEQVILARKETAKKNAEFALTTVETKIAETAALLTNAPKGKGSSMDIAAMQHDLNGLEESLGDVKKMIQSEDYLSVPSKVAPIQLKVTEIAAEVKTAIDKQTAMASAKKAAQIKKVATSKKKSVVKKSAKK